MNPDTVARARPSMQTSLQVEKLFPSPVSARTAGFRHGRRAGRTETGHALERQRGLQAYCLDYQRRRAEHVKAVLDTSSEWEFAVENLA